MIDKTDPMYLLTTEEVCQMMNVRKPWLHNEIKLGRITALKMGAQTIRIRRRDLDAYLESCVVAAG